MKRVVSIVSIVLLAGMALTGCRPRNVLSSSRLEDLLYDMHRAEAILQQAGYNYGHEDEVMKYHYEVLAAHGVTQAQFDSTIVWYTSHPTRYDKIYPRVLARIDKEMDKQSELENAARGEDLKPRNELRGLVDVMRDYLHGWKLIWYEAPVYQINVPYL